MNVVNALLVLGISLILVGALGPRFSRTVALRRRGFLVAGAVILAGSLVLGIPEFIQGVGKGLGD